MEKNASLNEDFFTRHMNLQITMSTGISCIKSDVLAPGVRRRQVTPG